MQRQTLLIAMIISMVSISGCGNPFGNLNKLVGTTRAKVKSKLGEPRKVEKAVCEPSANFEQQELTVAIPAGHPYEVWAYENEGKTHLIYFADPTNPDSNSEEWNVVLVSTIKETTL